MSTSIGELSVGVTLDQRKLDAGFKDLDRKTKAQVKQLDAEYKRLGESINRNAFGFSSGGTGGGRFSRSGFGGGGGGGGYSRSGMLIQNTAFQVQDIGVQIAGGQGVLRAFAQQLPQVLGAFGPAGAIGGAVIALGALAIQSEGFRAEVIKTAEGIANFMATGSFDEAVRGILSGQAAARMEADQAEQARAQGFDSFREYAAAVRGQRTSNRNLTRDLFFNSTDQQGQARILASEISRLERDARDAKAERRLLDFEKLRAEIATKRADLEKLNADIAKRQQEFDNAMVMARAARMDAEEAAERERVQGLRNTLDDVFRETERAVAQDSLGRVRDLIGAQRNPFASGGVSGFGSASANSALFAQEGNRLLTEAIRILRLIESNTEDQLARL